ncbi:hypothetical protein FRAAL3913 [Frankia alni ACN14a]|uniref:Uncharacterized protein n=1 Tax=Frankia alni (strain DSM 45986 / CECT 9034 / ACN14a) TaxID=326424 RepID=Q0RIV9_FRAAA|nr:hypothetical protein FRAAL3913 [Frankia alni ACN14a]
MVKLVAPSLGWGSGVVVSAMRGRTPAAETGVIVRKFVGGSLARSGWGAFGWFGKRPVSRWEGLAPALLRKWPSVSDNESANNHCLHEKKATECHHASLTPPCPLPRSVPSAMTSPASWTRWARFPTHGTSGRRSTAFLFFSP